MKKKMKTNTSFAVSPDLLEEAKKYCLEDNSSLSRQLEILLQKWVDEEREKRASTVFKHGNYTLTILSKDPKEIALQKEIFLNTVKHMEELEKKQLSIIENTLTDQLGPEYKIKAKQIKKKPSTDTGKGLPKQKKQS